MNVRNKFKSRTPKFYDYFVLVTPAKVLDNTAKCKVCQTDSYPCSTFYKRISMLSI